MNVENAFAHSTSPEWHHNTNRLETQKVFIRHYLIDSDGYIKYLREIQREGLEYRIRREDISHLFGKQDNTIIRSSILVSQDEVDRYNRKYPERQGLLNFSLAYRRSGVTPDSVRVRGKRGRPKGKRR